MKMLKVMLVGLFVSTSFGQTVISHYAEGKVFTVNGFTLEGQNLRLTMESVTLEVAGQDQVLLLGDVVQVMAKKGQGKRYGRNCGYLSLALNTLSYLASGGKYEDEDGIEQTREPGEFLMGTIMVGGFSYVVGYAIGVVTDDWEVVYLKRN